MGLLFLVLLAAMPLMAQHDMSNMGDMKDMKMENAVPNGMIVKHAKGWEFSFHGMAYVVDTQESGPVGGDKLFSVNWFMGTASHSLAGGTFTFESMLSLEPATVTGREYPELFQTGETAFGRLIDNGQHPHNFFMELALKYSHPLMDKTTWEIYVAPVGDPALGPVPYPHRISAEELPQAPLGHHLEDSTHISYDVVTAGLRRGIFHLEASGFHGAEPGENRWIIGDGAIDSYSARLTVAPNDNWSGQISAGHLTKPEALEPEDQARSEASITYRRSRFASSLIWGRVHKIGEPINLNGYGLEGVARFHTRNYVTGRAELVDKDELIVPGSYRIGAYTAGYTRDFYVIPGILTGVGANFTAYSTPEGLHATYGAHPIAVLMFMRFKLRDY
jgi:hypothetical protein